MALSHPFEVDHQTTAFFIASPLLSLAQMSKCPPVDFIINQHQNKEINFFLNLNILLPWFYHLQISRGSWTLFQRVWQWLPVDACRCQKTDSSDMMLAPCGRTQTTFYFLNFILTSLLLVLTYVNFVIHPLSQKGRQSRW